MDLSETNGKQNFNPLLSECSPNLFQNFHL